MTKSSGSGEATPFGLPVVFEKLDVDRGEIVELGRVPQSDSEGSSGTATMAEFHEYLETLCGEADEFVHEQTSVRHIFPTDVDLLRLYYVLKRGRSFGTTSPRVRSRVTHSAVERPLPFREFPLIALLYGFTEVDATFDALFELDYERPPLARTQRDDVMLVCRYRHGDDACVDLDELEVNHARLAGTALYYVSGACQLLGLGNPGVDLVEIVGYRASRPITATVHELPESTQETQMNPCPDAVWADAVESHSPSSAVHSRFVSGAGF